MSIPQRADETTTIRAFLDFFRDTLRRQCADLDAGQLAATLPPSTMTLGGMLKHLALVEEHWFSVMFLGRELGGIWRDVDWDADADWDWHSAVDDSPESLLALLDEAIAASDAVVRDALETPEGLAALSVRESRREGGQFSLRWIVTHMIEEYARHNGHADLIRESIDGVTGE